MHTGKCPKCEKVIGYASLQPIDIKEGISGPKWLGVSMQCPYCHTILSVGIDPIALKAEMVSDILKGLKR